VPNAAQDAALLEEIVVELQGIIKKRSVPKGLQPLLTKAVDQLSHKELLNEQDLVSTAKEQFIELVEHELAEDFKSTPAVQKLLKLLASKEPKPVKALTAKPLQQKKAGAGVPELNRFTRYIPNTRN